MVAGATFGSRRFWIKNMKPVLIIPGAQKCGTTTLTDLLVRALPGVQRPRVKERYFFSLPPEVIAEHMDWYRREVDETPGELFIDASTSYLPIAGTAELIREHLGEVPILIALRDPARRIISGFQHSNKKFASVDRRSLEQYLCDVEKYTQEMTLAEADQRAYEAGVAQGLVDGDYYGAEYLPQRNIAPIHAPQRDIGWSFKYFQVSSYAEQIARYEHVFGKEKVKVVRFEQLISDPASVVQDIAQWLGMEVRDPSEITLEHKNKTLVPRNRLARVIGQLRHHTPGIKHAVDFARKHTPALIQNFKKQFLLKKPESVPPEIHQRIEKLLADTK